MRRLGSRVLFLSLGVVLRDHRQPRREISLWPHMLTTSRRFPLPRLLLPAISMRLDDDTRSYLFMVCRFILAERIIHVIDRSGFRVLRKKNATGKQQHQMLHWPSQRFQLLRGESPCHPVGNHVIGRDRAVSYRFDEHSYSHRMKVNPRKHEYCCLVIQSATAN